MLYWKWLKKMNKIAYSIADMKAFISQMSSIYDAVRLVNASECCVMELGNDGKISYGTACFNVWNRTTRCKNCSSYRAHVTGMRQEKKEIFQNNVYHITSLPATLILDDGTPYYCIMELITVTGKSADASTEDRTEAEASSEDEKDVLTGLYNAEAFYRKVRETLKASPDCAPFIIYADIDDFKLVNDLFGRVRGNEILFQTSNILKGLCSGTDICTRLAADKFLIYMDSAHYDEQRFLNASREVKKLIGHSAITLHIRFGIYTIEDKSLAVTVMCDRAKIAFQTIRGDSQRFIAFYNAELMQQKLQEQKIISEFSDALAARQFQIYLQPQISAEKGLFGAEVLVRWQHPKQGLIAPGAFIGILEKTGLISRLDEYIWEEAVSLLKKWEGTERDGLHLSINISGKDFYYMDIYQTLTSLVEKYGISPQKLRLEITETVLMSDIEKLIAITNRLRAYGFFIEIDDFGKGYSSLSMLKDIDVDMLKIDMEFLRETEHQDKSKVILGTVINMSKQLGMNVITEGVETEKQVRHLQQLGCHNFQGFYFARPMPVADFEQKYFGKQQ